MPNLTMFIPSDTMPSDEALARLTARCTQLCLDILKAALGNVHIIYVPVRHGRGHRVFAEIRYRLEPSRTPAIMDAFMEELDNAIQSDTGLVARIRCFGYAASAIHARH
ncbi:hypothetical protein [Dyella sp.]|uniref:hypothetical protein n=1 Tax=Dyella sp. TaxID=1869338 RepID=UPI002ED3472F